MGRFRSDSTTTGLRVTSVSALSLLKYLAENAGFFTTSRLGNDTVEHMFGIVHQFSG